MAKIPAVVTVLDEVPEPLRELYVEDNGRWVLDTDVDAHPRTRGLKSALDKEKANRRAIREFSEKGMDVAEVLQKLEEAEHLEAQVEQRMAEAIRREREEARKRELAVKQELDTELSTSAAKAAEAAAMRALAEHGASDLLLPHVLPRLKAQRVAPGQYQVQVVDEQGVAQEMGVGEYVASLKDVEKYAPAFRGSGASGSGAPVNGRGGATKPVRSLADLPNEEAKAAYYREHGAEAFNRLVEADRLARRAS